LPRMVNQIILSKAEEQVLWSNWGEDKRAWKTVLCFVVSGLTHFKEVVYFKKPEIYYGG
jgi:hypothetical protein